MKKAVLALAVFFIALSAAAQEKAQVTIGNGHLTKETREVGPYTTLNAKGPFQIRLVPGTDTEVSVEADNNIIGLIVTEVKNGELTIAPKEGELFKSGGGNKIVVKVPADALTAIAFKGSGSITSKKTLRNDLKLTLDGAGTMDLNVASGTTEALLLGSGTMTLWGSTGNFRCFVKGEGSVAARQLESAKVDVSITGTGSALVFSKSSIKGRISGSGNVAFTGNPQDRDLKREGTGEFRSL